MIALVIDEHVPGEVDPCPLDGHRRFYFTGSNMLHRPMLPRFCCAKFPCNCRSCHESQPAVCC